MTQLLNKQVRKSGMWITLQLILGSGIGFLVSIYVVRILPVAEYGIYNLMFALVAYVGLVTSFGVIHVFQRYIPELFKHKDICALRALVVHGLLLQMALSIVCIGVIILFSGTIGTLLKVGNWVNYFELFSPVIVLSLEVGLLSVVLASLFLHKYIAIAYISYALMRAVTVFIVLSMGLGLKGLFLSEVAAWGLLAIMLIRFYCSKFIRLNPVENKTHLQMKRFFRYGGYSFLNDIGNSIFDVSTDYFVLAIFVGPIAVGIYAFANRIIQLFSRCLPNIMFQNLITPTFFTKYAEAKDPKELDKMFNLLIKFNAFLFFPFAIGVWVLGDKMILYVFGAKYLSALIPLWIIVTFRAIYACTTSIGLVIKAIEKVEILLKAKLFSIYNLVGDILVAEKYGVIGIALITGSAILFQKIFCYLYAKKYTNITIDWKGLCKIFMNSILMGILLCPFRTIITNIYTLVLVVIAGIGIYGVAAYFNKAFSFDERNLLNKVLPKPIFNF